MRNYYRTLEIDNDSSEEAIRTSLQQLSQIEPDLTEKAEAILLNPIRRAVYDNLHLQYEAIATAHRVFSEEGMLDTNDWSLRLVEFYARED